jgi:hypothetical protein
MFQPNSRYFKLPVLVHVLPDGQPVPYVSRRFLPRGEDLPLLAEVEAQSGDRPDLIAHRTLGDPTAFWCVADANDVMDPGELTDEAGEVLRIPVPQP